MILLFVKYPIPGQVKTRLIPALGATRAARLHRRMTEAALDQAQASGLPVVVCATGAPLRQFRAWLGTAPSYVCQGSGDLGRRMKRAVACAFRQGATKVLAIGADVPGITADRLRDAAAALDSADVVLGPASDGGYYLIGMRRLHAHLLRNIAWGSDTVLACTRTLIANARLTCRELPVLPDVDRPEDLDAVRGDTRLADARLPQGYEAAIHLALDDPSVALGAFRFKIDWPSPAMRIVELGTNLRSRWLRWPYGDQGLFVERRAFDAAGAFPSRQLMEDFALVRRLRRCGRVLTLSLAINTSARRWKKHGALRVWAINQLYAMPAEPSRSLDSLHLAADKTKLWRRGCSQTN